MSGLSGCTEAEGAIRECARARQIITGQRQGPGGKLAPYGTLLSGSGRANVTIFADGFGQNIGNLLILRTLIEILFLLCRDKIDHRASQKQQGGKGQSSASYRANCGEVADIRAASELK